MLAHAIQIDILGPGDIFETLYIWLLIWSLNDNSFARGKK